MGYTYDTIEYTHDRIVKNNVTGTVDHKSPYVNVYSHNIFIYGELILFTQ